jgi:uncharacterized membrane protein
MKNTRIVLFIISIISLVITAYYWINASHADGALCSFDSFDCDSNKYFFKALPFALLTGILIIVDVILLIALKQKNKNGKHT